MGDADASQGSHGFDDEAVTDREPAARSALFTDLYELTMLAAYHAEGLAGNAVFELFFRELPPNRNYVVAAGLEDVLAYLENLRFRPSDLEWLSTLGGFDDSFLDSLASFRFTGDVYAMPEGSVAFPDEPLIRVEAPLPQAQLIETWVLNQMHVQSLAASKAARIVHAAAGRSVADFGSRRAHGADAALKVARAAYLGGIDGTSNVLAARRYGIPCLGTMAHSYVQAHDDEDAAFEAFTRTFPRTTLLVDTYDVLEGVERVVELARRRGRGFQVQAIRIDSGELETLIPRARARLDEAGLAQVKIMASGGLDEYRVRALVEAGVPVDGFGIGTDLAVSGDSPHLDLSYKLVAYEDSPRMKLSEGKISMPGRKQVFRRMRGGEAAGDMLACAGERHEGEPMLEPLMRGGRRTERGHWTLEDARQRCARSLAALPQRLHAPASLSADEAYPVSVSDELSAMRDRLAAGLKHPAGNPNV